MTEVNEKLIIKMYLDGISGHKIAASIGLKPHQVYYILKKNNIESRDNSINSKRFQFNENFFETIDSEPKAYWLGFLFADGYILTNSNSFGLSLSTKDISHMEKFLKDISSNHKINIYRNNSNREYCRIRLYSKKAKEDLIKVGCVENKTLILGFPKIREDLLPHFIRGYFDGDGAISKTKSKKSFSYRFRLCGTREFLTGVLNVIGYNSRLYQRHPERNVNNYEIDIGGNRQVLDILSFIYKDATVYLERKYNRFLGLKSLCQEIDNRKLCENGETL